MHFNTHYRIAAAGSHAFLSASKYSWINYDDDKLEMVYTQSEAAAKGSRLHDLAAKLIKEGIKLPRASTTLNMYVNDAIGFRMTPEQILFFSDNAYGTADAISFRKNLLRIHDLKTGLIEASRYQLDIYAAFFCLEYRMNPFDIDMELRIYQNDAVQIYEKDADLVMHIMEKAKRFDKIITDRQMADLGL
jgi:hypothetical protein